MKKERNRPLFGAPVHEPAIDKLALAVGGVDHLGPRTSDEEHARMMDRGVERVANWLGVCSECWDDLQIVDGKWVCFGCKPEPPLDVTAEDLRGSDQ